MHFNTLILFYPQLLRGKLECAWFESAAQEQSTYCMTEILPEDESGEKKTKTKKKDSNVMVRSAGFLHLKGGWFSANSLISSHVRPHMLYLNTPDPNTHTAAATK